ncbi:TolC family protein [bacterium]|nr:TolC family protein [bacterium]
MRKTIFLLKIIFIVAGIFTSFTIDNSVWAEEKVLPPFTIEKAIETALENNKLLKNYFEDLEAAKAKLKAAKRHFWPKLDLRTRSNKYYDEDISSSITQDYPGLLTSIKERTYHTGGLHLGQPLPTGGNIGFGGTLGHQEYTSATREYAATLSKFGFSLSQPLFQENELKAKVKRIEFQLKIEEANTRSFQSKLIYEVRASYYNGIRQDKILKMQKAYFDLLQSNLKAGRIKHKLGQISDADLLVLEAKAITAQINADRTEVYLAYAKDSLRQLMGEDYDFQFSPQEEEIPPFRELVLEEEVAKALKNRPELKKYETQIRLAELGLKKYKKERNPNIRLGGYYNWKGVGDNIRGSTEEFANEWGANVKLTYPLWDGGVSKSEIKSAQLKKKARETTLRNEKDKIVLGVRQAVRYLEEVQPRIEKVSKIVTAAEEVLKVAVLLFEKGEIVEDDVLEAHLFLLKSRLKYVGTLFDYHLAIARLDQVTAAR